MINVNGNFYNFEQLKQVYEMNGTFLYRLADTNINTQYMERYY